MTTFDLWVQASQETEEALLAESEAKAMVALSETVSFLRTSSRTDYRNRLALVEDKIDRVVSAVAPDPAYFAVLRARVAELIERESLQATSKKVEVYLNETVDEDGRPTGFFRGYREGDTMRLAISYEDDGDDMEIAARAFEEFNIGNGPLAQEYRAGRNRSLSVGDLVKIDGVAYSVEPFGWKRRAKKAAQSTAPERRTVNGMTFLVWPYYDRAGKTVYQYGGLVKHPECGAQISYESLGPMESYMERHSTPGAFGACRLLSEAKKADPSTASLRKGAPFAGYESFEACVAANQDKDDANAYCGSIKHKVEDSKKSKRKTALTDADFEIRELEDAARDQARTLGRTPFDPAVHGPLLRPFVEQAVYSMTSVFESVIDAADDYNFAADENAHAFAFDVAQAYERELRLQGLARRKTAWTAPKSEYSGACADGDHDACRMDHLPDDICLCTHSSHGVNAPRGFSPDAYNDMSGACADGDHAACRMTHADISAYCLCPEHRERSGFFGRRKTAAQGQQYDALYPRGYFGKKTAQDDAKARMLADVDAYMDGAYPYDNKPPAFAGEVPDDVRSMARYQAGVAWDTGASWTESWEAARQYLWNWYHSKKATRKTASKRYETAKAVVESRQAQKMEGTTLDTTSAQALITVYEALNADNQAKFDSIPLDKLMEFVWSKVSHLARKRVNRKTAASDWMEFIDVVDYNHDFIPLGERGFWLIGPYGRRVHDTPFKTREEAVAWAKKNWEKAIPTTSSKTAASDWTEVIDILDFTYGPDPYGPGSKGFYASGPAGQLEGPFKTRDEAVAWAKKNWQKFVTSKTANSEYEDLLRRASEAGFRALNAATPTPMVVQQHAHPFDDNSPVVKEWYVSEGASGFAWVNIKGTTGFARYVKATRFDAPHHQKESEGGSWSADSYYGGYSFWIWAGGQSLDRKKAFARAFAEVLTQAGIDARAMSRMD